MTEIDPGEITQLLAALSRGDRPALDRLMELVYQDLRRRAHFKLLSSGGTLSTTALVHETYLRLAGAARPDWENRRHFFNVAACAMRQILVDYARERGAAKRGGDARRVELDSNQLAVEQQATELLEIDRALGRLASIDERLAQVVNLRFFAGLTEEETGELLQVSSRTVKRDWQKARTLLHQLLTEGASAQAG
ncbi:MAG: ECF-type sigma factor [Thermoanaerobaculia bacterium]